jgi:HK97 family phage major capsid protein
MPNTSSNYLIPEILEAAIPGAFAGKKALMGTRATIVRGNLPEGSRKGGKTVTIPYFGNIGELEDLASELDSLSPAELTMTSEEAEVQHSGKMFSVTEAAEIFAEYADPYGEAAGQIAEATMRRGDAAVIDAACAAGLPSEMVKDVWSAGTPRKMDYDLVVDGKMAWGDEHTDIALMVIHSKVYGDLLKIKETTGKPILTDAREGEVQRFCGIPLIVSDRLPVDLTDPAHPKYTSVIAKAGALVFWYARNPKVLTDQNIANNSRSMAVHVYWAAHRYKRLPNSTKPGVVLIKHN